MTSSVLKIKFYQWPGTLSAGILKMEPAGHLFGRNTVVCGTLMRREGCVCVDACNEKEDGFRGVMKNKKCGEKERCVKEEK